MEEAGMKSDRCQSRNWHIQLEKNAHSGFTGSEMKPFLVKL